MFIGFHCQDDQFLLFFFFLVYSPFANQLSLHYFYKNIFVCNDTKILTYYSRGSKENCLVIEK